MMEQVRKDETRPRGRVVMLVILCSCAMVTTVAPRFSLRLARRSKWRDLSAAST